MKDHTRAIEALFGRRVVGVLPTAVGFEVIFDGDYSGNMLRIDLMTDRVQIGTAVIKDLAEIDLYYAGVYARLRGVKPHAIDGGLH